MNRSPQFNKFDRKYLFLEYHLTNFLPLQGKLKRNLITKNQIQVKTEIFSLDLKDQSLKITKKNLELNRISSYLQFVESTIEKDFLLVQYIWSFFKIYSKPKLFKLFPNRRSFLCYWIFPFVGFITISNFNNGIQTSTQALSTKDFLKPNWQVNWDNLEYLNYKKLFLPTNTLNNNINKTLSQTKNTQLIINRDNTKDMFLLNLSKNTNFEKNQIETLITNCNLYLSETAKSIYANTSSNKLINRNSIASLSEKKKAFHKIPNQIDKKNFKVNNFAETILGTQFNYNTLLEYYWYDFNLLNMNKNQISSLLGKYEPLFEKQSVKLHFQRNYPSVSKKKSRANWKSYLNFPYKLLITSSKILDRDKQTVIIFDKNHFHSFNFGDMINLEFNEIELIPNLVKQFKNKLRFSEESQPIFFYQKASLLLSKLIEKFEIDFSIDLKTQHLTDNIYKQELTDKLANTTKLQSRFLDYLDKFLITSKLLDKTSNSFPSLVAKYEPIKKFPTYLKSENLGSVSKEKTQPSDVRSQPQLKFNYYLLTKKNLYAILLKKVFFKSTEIKICKKQKYHPRDTVSKLISIYNLQKKVIKQEHQQLSQVVHVHHKPNLFILVNASKLKFKKLFLLAKLNFKMQKQLQTLVDQWGYNSKQHPNLNLNKNRYSSLLVIKQNKPKTRLKAFFSYDTQMKKNKTANNFLNFNQKPDNSLIKLISILKTYSPENEYYVQKFQNDKGSNSNFAEKVNSKIILNLPKILESKLEFIYFSDDPVLVKKPIWLKKNNDPYSFSTSSLLTNSLALRTEQLPFRSLQNKNFQHNIVKKPLIQTYIKNSNNHLPYINTHFVNFNIFNDKLFHSLVNFKNSNKKMKLIVNNLNINNKLIKNTKLKALIKYNNSNFFAYSGGISSKEKNLKNHIRWSDVKIKHLNLLFTKNLNRSTHSKINFQKTQQHIINRFNEQTYFDKYLNKTNTIILPKLNQLYYINRVNQNSLNFASKNLYSKQKVASTQLKFLKLNPLNKISSNQILLNNSQNLLQLNRVAFDKKLDNVKNVRVPQQFSCYIENLANQLKNNLLKSKLYVIKISKRKKINFQSIFNNNFYININKNKTLSFKSNKVKYKIRKKTPTYLKILNFSRKPIQLTPPIEKIFRNYLSSKYNKGVNYSLQRRKKIFATNKNSFLTLTQFNNLEFLKKQSTFCDFKLYNKDLNLKIQKEFFTQNDKTTRFDIIHSNSSNSNFIPKESDKTSLPIINTNIKSLNHSVQSSYNLIKKIGFLFFKNEGQGLSDPFVAKNLPSNFHESGVNFNGNLKTVSETYPLNLDDYKKNYFKKTHKKQILLKRLEKAKNLQKKRRQKKQARLTGRRKKRKRFFPRPIWLRLLLYKKFLKFRHSSNFHSITVEVGKKNLTINSNISNVLKFLGKKHQTKFTLCRKIKTTFHDKPSVYLMERNKEKLSDRSLREIIYRSNKQNWGNIFFDIPQLEKITLKKFLLLDSLPIFGKIQFYDISKNVVQDFKKTMWKSYWLRTNFPNYTKKIQSYLDEIKHSITESSILVTLKQFLFEMFGLNFSENSLKFFNVNFNFTNYSVLLKKEKKQILNLDFREYKDKIANYNNLDLPKTQTKYISKLIKNKNLNYSPLWYLNIRQNFLHYSIVPTGYLYLETSNLEQFNSSLYNRIQHIIKNMKSNLNVDGHSQVRAFNPGRSDRSGLNSNNFFENLLKEWWTNLENSLNYSVSFLTVPQEIYLNQAKFRILWSLNKTNSWSFKKSTDTSLTWNHSKRRDQNKSNKTNKNLQIFFNKIKYGTKNKSKRRQKLLYKIFLDKVQNTNQKIKQLGLLLTDKEYREIKVNLVSSQNNQKINSRFLYSTSINSSLNKDRNLKNEVSNLLLKENLTSYFKTNPKHYLQFWWSESKFKNYFIVQTAFSFKNDVFLPVFPNSNQGDSTNNTNNIFFLRETSKYQVVTITTCLILLHLCLLFTLLNIGQIRTFLKFQLLCIYKLTNIYFTIIYSTFKNLTQLKITLYLYSNISKNLLKNLMVPKKSFLLLQAKEYYKEFNLPLKATTFKVKHKDHLLTQNKGQISRKLNSNQLPNLIFYSNNPYSQYEDFEKFILKSFEFSPSLVGKYEPINFSQYPLNLGIQPSQSNFTDKSYLQLYTLLQNVTTDSKLVNSQSTIYSDGLAQISHIQNKSEFLRIIIEKKIQKATGNTFTLQPIKPITTPTILRTNNFPNFILYNIFNSTNLVCYNSLKFILGFKQTLSLIPHRSFHQFSYLQNFKRLPNQYQSFANLVLNKYIVNSFYLSILFVVSIVIKIANKTVIGLYIILFKLIDLIEGLMLIIYKSLEKPAELMIDFISEFFLIEWSSDIVSFIPETLDIYMSGFSQKLSRNFRIFGFTSFFAQRRFLSFMDSFLEGMTRPDIDLIIRQKKGIIFWDIWAEILVQSAEIYSINLSSLFNIKEEQDLFLERLINEKKWTWSTDVLNKMSPLMDLLQNVKPIGFSKNSSLCSNSEQIWRRWSVNPYYTYQAKDTDLFVENHPPKSFSHFKLMKYYPPVFEPVGTLVCQIYAGQFVKNISKNLLLVGSRGTNKTLLIQALAGETELKIMIDNAKRYALTSKGMAIGMKLLKDVFDALALQAPCLFIIEDIHIIGERRPMLISDDENIKAMENSFGVDQEEIHEKNQVMYQLSRHSIVHYKKPYKGDFSLLIPTNHFALDLFLGSAPPKTRFIAHAPQNPLPVQAIEQEILYQNESNENSSLTYKQFFSHLQLPRKEIFSPPSTSPFTILLLKEQKKIKPKKIVAEMPWGGLSADQLIQLPKASYSVRVKVALLADIAIRNLSVKLDRITDLLIIIDSVRSHRGFVVIGTTHVPSILDPALRRPGRFDETLTIPALPNLWSRWEILKASVSDFSSTLDLIDLAQLFNRLNDTELLTILGKTKLFLLTKKSFLNKNVNIELGNQLLKSNKIKSLVSTNSSYFIEYKKFQHSDVNVLNSFANVLKVANYPIIIEPFGLKQNKNFYSKFDKNINRKDLIFKNSLSYSNLNPNTNSSSDSFILTSLKPSQQSNSLVSNLKSFNSALAIFKTSTNCLAISYCQISKWFINSQLIKDRTSYTSLLWSTISKNSLQSSASLFSSENFNSMPTYVENKSMFTVYSSRLELKNQLVQLFAGKIGEFFIFYDIKSMTQLLQKNHYPVNINMNNSIYKNSRVAKKTNYEPFWQDFQSINAWKYSNIINSYGLDETWQRTSDLIFSIIYKRCLYNKNILIHRLFNIHNIKSLRQPPSPPVSTSFTSAKRYENYKRIEFDLQNRLTFSIHEKIQNHQQQRYIKTLYAKPIQKYFRSEAQNSTKNFKSSNSNFTTFENSFREISLIDINQKLKSQNKSSRLSSTFYLFNNRINIRHRFYLINQWWNTQLAEHNAETTFLSEIDWRYMFMDGIGDLWMDFPDTDQHYNPRTRQWMVTSGYWSYWYNFEKVITQEIYYQFLMESFYKAYNVLETSRELLDLTCYDFLTSSVLKEIDLINYLKRFYK